MPSPHGYINNAGDIRQALQDFPDDARVMAQVVAEDGSVWCMNVTIRPVVGGKPPIVGISLRHPLLKYLPEPGQEKAL